LTPRRQGKAARRNPERESHDPVARVTGGPNYRTGPGMMEHGAVDDLQTVRSLSGVREHEPGEGPVVECPSGDDTRLGDLAATEGSIVQSNVGLEHRGEPTNGVFDS
jgi:hypothetical protein